MPAPSARTNTKAATPVHITCPLRAPTSSRQGNAAAAVASAISTIDAAAPAAAAAVAAAAVAAAGEACKLPLPPPLPPQPPLPPPPPPLCGEDSGDSRLRCHDRDVMGPVT